jgi:uncharacterized protein YgiM (DUF1202 family)
LCAQLAGDSFVSSYAAHNQRIVAIKTAKKNAEPEIGFFSACLRSIGLFWLQIFFLIAWFLLLFFIKKYKHGTKYKSLWLGLSLCLTIVTGVILGLKYHSNSQRRGIIMKQAVSLFAGPDEQYHVVGALEKGAQVFVHEQRSSWCKVSHATGSGWLAHDAIVVV